MIARMGPARPTGPDPPAAPPPDGQVTGVLPEPLTSFIGRSREVDELRSVFRAGGRLVTLVGIGGIGKTRFALEMGARAREPGRGDVYLAELAALTPEMVNNAVLESVG